MENGWYKINLDDLYRILTVLGADLGEIWPAANAKEPKKADEQSWEAAVSAALAQQTAKKHKEERKVRRQDDNKAEQQ